MSTQNCEIFGQDKLPFLLSDETALEVVEVCVSVTIAVRSNVQSVGGLGLKKSTFPVRCGFHIDPLAAFECTTSENGPFGRVEHSLYR
jgi:hypothetical protein